MAIGAAISATERHYQPGPWYDMPKAEFTMQLDSQAVLDLIEKAITN